MRGDEGDEGEEEEEDERGPSCIHHDSCDEDDGLDRRKGEWLRGFLLDGEEEGEAG